MNQKKTDHPGIYIPPPTFIVGFLVLGFLANMAIPLRHHFFSTIPAIAAGGILIIVSTIFGLPAVIQFIKSKTSAITFKSASSLQTTGLYSISRNPMYLGLLSFYLGISFLFGNWWHFILFPALYAIFLLYIILREERYLESRFGDSYLDYKRRVRRWL